MNYRTARNILLVMVTGLLALCLGGCSSSTDNAERAKEVARSWVATHIDDVSDKLASVVSKDYSAIAGFGIKLAIKQGVHWEYTATRNSSDRWRVVAIARINFNIPGFNKEVDISGGIPLTINTAKPEVTSFDFDTSSFKYSFNSTAEEKSAQSTNNVNTPAKAPEEKSQSIDVSIPVKAVEEKSTQSNKESGDASAADSKNFKDCADCPEMAVIPGGSFDMGSNEGEPKMLVVAPTKMVKLPGGLGYADLAPPKQGEPEEMPVHRVTISHAFAMGKTEVTQGQWKAIMGDNPSHFSNCGDNCPVEQVSWNDAHIFIQKLNAKTGKQYRLPTEAEWEYACRAGGSKKYCGGDNPDNVGWYGAMAKPAGNSGKTTNPVGQKQANAFGLFDMSGNVWEWVEDSYHDSYNGAPTDGSAWQGDGAKHTLRGGAWSSNSLPFRSEPLRLRAAVRDGFEPAMLNADVGFRLAR